MILVKKPNTLIELIRILKEKGIPESQYKLYMDRFLEFKAREKAIPLHGTFELTPLCNLDCKMCYVHLSGEQFDSRELMPVATWKKLIKEAYEAGMRKASLTGGECLTYPGFNDVYIYLYELGIVPSVLSNGLLIDDNRIEFFKKYPPRIIQVTLYGSSEDSYEAVTGQRVFGRIYGNIKRIKEAGLNLHISLTPSFYVQDDIFKLIDRVEELDLPYNINSCLKPPRENTGRTAKDMSNDRYADMYIYYNKLRGVDCEPIDLESLPEENHVGKKRNGLRCGAGKSAFAIMYDGRMCPCFSLRETLANPIEEGFITAWRQINDIASSYPIPKECNGCVYYPICLTCPAIHTNAIAKGHCDTRVCERTKKLVSAGAVMLPKISDVLYDDLC